MEERARLDELSLLGGPLHRLGCRLGLQSGPAVPGRPSTSPVRNMRWAPVSLKLLKDIALAALLPILPLLPFQYPVAELAQKFFTRLTGL